MDIINQLCRRPSGRLSCLYRWLSVSLVPVTLFTIFLTVGLDLCPLPYISPFIESVFMYQDITPLVSAVLVVWTFSATLVVYFMGKMSDRCFGIHFYDAVLTHEGKNWLLVKAFLFLIEIALLAGFAVYGFRISFTVLCLLQMLNMGYIFLMVNLETSRNHVLFWVNDENGKVFQKLKNNMDMEEISDYFNKESSEWLLIKILRGIDYDDSYEMEYLLKQLFSQLLDELKDAAPDTQLIISCELALRMIAYGSYDMESGINLRPAIRDLFSKIIESNNCPVPIKEGVLASLVIRLNSSHGLTFFENLIQSISDAKILSWCYTFLNKLAQDYSNFNGWLYRFKQNIELYTWEYAMSDEERAQVYAFIRCYANRSSAESSYDLSSNGAPQEEDDTINV